jgi:hypothetical protein
MLVAEEIAHAGHSILQFSTLRAVVRDDNGKRDTG